MAFYRKCEECGYQYDISPYEGKSALSARGSEHTHCSECNGEMHVTAKSNLKEAAGAIGLVAIVALSSILNHER